MECLYEYECFLDLLMSECKQYALHLILLDFDVSHMHTTLHTLSSLCLVWTNSILLVSKNA